MQRTPVQTLLSIALLLASMTATAGDAATAWLEAGDDQSARQVNEGGLEFLRDAQGRRVLQTRNRLTITPASLHNGWVRLYQCQGNIDPVDAVQILYRYHGLRNLRISSSSGMKRAWVSGHSVQMEQVEERGEVCIKAEVQVLKSDGKGGFSLQSGPFHRRFLDGYYPVHLDYRIRWPAGLLQLTAVEPPMQEGFPIRVRPGELAINTLFEGKLTVQGKWRALQKGAAPLGPASRVRQTPPLKPGSEPGIPRSADATPQARQ